jgi:hypothetical protein
MNVLHVLVQIMPDVARNIGVSGHGESRNEVKLSHAMRRHAIKFRRRCMELWCSPAKKR